jgi:hypothetical protein
MACCDREFPRPDPMFRFIDEDEGPGWFWAIEDHNEQSRRLRMYLLALAAGEHPMMAWLAAGSMYPDHIEQMHQLVDVMNRDDKRIEAQLKDLATRDRRAILNG